MTLEFEVDVGYLTDGGIKGMPTWVKLNDDGGERTSTVYVNTSSYWHVVDENAKLRELVGFMWRCIILPSERFLWPEIADRLRELGVEVEQ